VNSGHEESAHTLVHAAFQGVSDAARTVPGPGSSGVASKSDSKQVIVRIAGVFDAFVRAVSAYEEGLRRDVAPSGRFSAMHANYGTVAYFARPA